MYVHYIKIEFKTVHKIVYDAVTNIKCEGMDLTAKKWAVEMV